MKIEKALEYAARGWKVFPCLPDGKAPMTPTGFKDASKDPDRIREWWAKTPDANIGLATGMSSGIVVLDVDVKNGAKGEESFATLPDLPPSRMARTPSGGRHLYYIPRNPLKSRIGLLPGLDFKAEGGYVLAPGSEIKGSRYEWADPAMPIVPVPPIVLAVLDNRSLGQRPCGKSDGNPIPKGTRNVTLTSLAGTLRNQGLGYHALLEKLRSINSQHCQPPLPNDEIERIACSISRYPISNRETGTDSTPPTDQAIMPFTEDALANRFSEQYADDWRFVTEWGQWLVWDGQCWRPEKTCQAFHLARLVCREAAVECPRTNQKGKLAAASTVAALERLARADRRHAASTGLWDQDPWLLSTPSGLVDLRTGQCGPAQRDAFITKLTQASPTTEPATKWLAFLNDVTNGDVELQRYLARVAGYALTGLTREHALFFFYGTGANGKSVFLNTLAAIAGDYAVNAPIDTFLETKSDRHPTDLAGLRGARIVISTEVENGRRWAEAKIKTATGGDKIAARFMRQDFFEYRPQFKLLIAGNHKPALRDVDEAMRRRLHLIPFTVTIPAEKRDKDLAEKLLTERDSIQRWTIDGCLDWQKRGLEPPTCVRSATDEYFDAEDALGRWMNERCVRNRSAWALTSQLFDSWRLWATEVGEPAWSLRQFSEALAQRGFQKDRQAGVGRVLFRGIGLAAAEDPRFSSEREGS
jgi:P4 family phage/plasmid primase-like protien